MGMCMAHHHKNNQCKSYAPAVNTTAFNYAFNLVLNNKQPKMIQSINVGDNKIKSKDGCYIVNMLPVVIFIFSLFSSNWRSATLKYEMAKHS